MTVTLSAYGQARFPGKLPQSASTLASSSQIDVPSPVAWSLGRYGDVPVSYFTGRADVSIPIYDFTVRGVTLPVNVSYDTGGVLVNAAPGLAGQNWTLNAGGVITRSVKGWPDEWVCPKNRVVTKTHNYFECHNKLEELLTNGKKDNYKSLRNEVDNIYEKWDLSPDIFTFNFMGKTGRFFLDSQGNWRVFSNDNLEVIFDYRDIKSNNFTYPIFKRYPGANEDQPRTIAGFKLRDDKGNVYTFGYNSNAIEYTTDFWHINRYENYNSWSANSWYLTKVEDKYGNVLFRLNYDRGSYTIQIFNAYNWTTYSQGGPGSKESGVFSDNITFPYSFSLTSPVYLQSIEGQKGIRIRFSTVNVDDDQSTENIYNSVYDGLGSQANIYATLCDWAGYHPGLPGSGYQSGGFYYLSPGGDCSGAALDSINKYRFVPKDVTSLQSKDDPNVLRYSRFRKLSVIVIEGAKGKTYRGYRFCYSKVNRRLRLDSIMVQDDAINYTSSTGVLGVYKFKYNQFEKLPSDYLTTAVDHWGYYNGNPYNVKNGSIKPASFAATREPNFTTTLYGSLSQIEYPTGGVTTFEYEQNAYGSYLSDDRQDVYSGAGKAGGLRVKSIKDYEDQSLKNLLKEKDYSYDMPTGIHPFGTRTGTTYRCSGILFAKAKYYWKDCQLPTCSKGYFTCTMFHAASIIPLANSFGPSIGYSQVTETVKDLAKQNGQNIVKKVYTYSNLSDRSNHDQQFDVTFNLKNTITPYDEYSEIGFKNGQLLQLTVFDGNGNKIQSTEYKYRSDNYLNHYLLTSNLVGEGYSMPDPRDGLPSTTWGYHYIGGVYKLYYPKYDVIQESDTIFGKTASGQGSYTVTTTTYNNKDVEYTTNYGGYSHKNYIRLPQEEKVVSGQTSKSILYTYGDFREGGKYVQLYHDMSSIVPIQIAQFENGKKQYSIVTEYTAKRINNKNYTVPQYITKHYASGCVDTLMYFKNYSITGKPTLVKELGKPDAYYVWGYHDNYLVAKNYITSMGLTMPSDNKFFDGEDNLQVMLDNLHSHPYCYPTFYIYNFFGGIAAMISQDGTVTHYKYDKFNRLSGIYNDDNKPVESYNYHTKTTHNR